MNSRRDAPWTACVATPRSLARPTEHLRRAAALAVATAVALLAACASGPPRSTDGGPAPPTAGVRPGPAPSADRDGPPAQAPPDLASVPDAEPRIEPVRAGGPNKPYEVLGREYVPITSDRPFVERGLGSWYGRKFHGRRTASGELYNMYEMTAAHPTLPIPSYARVRNPANGREVVVRINDRGPFSPGRIVDLSYTAALKLDLLRGVAPVEVERITSDDIRSGAWRRGPTELAQAAPAAAPPAPAAARTGTPPTTTPAPVGSTVPPAPPPAFAAGGAAVLVATAATAPPLPAEPAPAADAAPPPTAGATAPEPAQRAYTQQAQGYWVQLGAFRERSGAEAFQRRVATELAWLAPLMAIFNETAVHRLQAGPYASRDEAGSASQRIRKALQLVPVIVERR